MPRGKDIEDSLCRRSPLARPAETACSQNEPTEWASPGPSSGPPTVVGDCRCTSRLRAMASAAMKHRGLARQVVVAVDRRPWGHTAHTDTVVPCGDDAGNVRAVVLQGCIYAAVCRCSRGCGTCRRCPSGPRGCGTSRRPPPRRSRPLPVTPCAHAASTFTCPLLQDCSGATGMQYRGSLICGVV